MFVILKQNIKCFFVTLYCIPKIFCLFQLENFICSNLKKSWVSFGIV